MKIMVRLQILSIKNNLCTLRSDEDIIYQLKINLYDVGYKIQEGDFVSISEKLLDPTFEEYSDLYQFGPLESKYGRPVTDKIKDEIIRIDTNQKKIYLKRIFG